MANVFIVGAGGQDGRILLNYLKNEEVICFYKERISFLSERREINIEEYKKEIVFDMVRRYNPQYLYYLAGYHHSSEESQGLDIDVFERSNFTHAVLFSYFLEAMRLYAPKGRIFYAASSLIYGNPKVEILDENRPINPICLYGITKATGFFLAKYYREKHNMFVSNGILFNHESEYRPERFLFTKVIKRAFAIKNGLENKLLIGNLKAVNDWGYAYDYVKAMINILNLKNADDFVIASGEAHSVEELVEIVFSHLGLNYKDYVCEDSSLIVRNKPVLIGNPSKLIKATGWKREVSFKEMIIRIMDALRDG